MHALLKKKFSQNFLIDQNISRNICNLIPKTCLNILEIGPGDGKLTEKILNKNLDSLTLIEIDEDLIIILNKKFYKNENVKVLNKDVLNYNFDDPFDLIISNLPYKISSKILIRICLLNLKPKYLILMFQKEFALRLIDQKLNSLNSLVKCFYDIKLKINVSRNCYRPVPKVDSAVLFFTSKTKALLEVEEINNFINFKRKIFSHKRKTLNNLLKEYKFQKDNFDLTKRVEDISIDQFLRIFRAINL